MDHSVLFIGTQYKMSSHLWKQTARSRFASGKCCPRCSSSSPSEIWTNYVVRNGHGCAAYPRHSLPVRVAGISSYSIQLDHGDCSDHWSGPLIHNMKIKRTTSQVQWPDFSNFHVFTILHYVYLPPYIMFIFVISPHVCNM